MIYRFARPDIKIMARLRAYSQDEIRLAPMLFSADSDFAALNGGAITNDFLSYLDPKERWVIDSRVHMLMPGWYPCIPGWHHDDVPRDREDGQPDYDNPSYQSEHVACVIDCGTGSLTEFVTSGVALLAVPVGKVIYREWDDEIRRIRPAVRVQQVKSGEILSFSCEAFHRGVPAVGNGWRWFIRASRNTKRPILNELRTQVQVYMPSITAGW